MREFQHIVRTTLLHEQIVDFLFHHHAAQWLRAVGNLLGKIQNIRCDAEFFGTGVSTDPAESGNDFIKNQQDVVLVADFA